MNRFKVDTGVTLLKSGGVILTFDAYIDGKHVANKRVELPAAPEGRRHLYEIEGGDAHVTEVELDEKGDPR